MLIFLHESFDPFYQTISSFPTVVFSFLLLLSVLFWLAAILGVVDIDIIDVSAAAQGDSLHTDGLTNLGGLLMKLRLDGVPFTVSLSIIAFFGWLISYYSIYFTAPHMPDAGIISFAWKLVIFLFASYLSALITAACIKPLKPFFKEITKEHSTENFIGRDAIVRTSTLNTKFGEVSVEDGGAGLILKARTDEDHGLSRGDKVVLFEYIESENIYKVLPKSVFEEMKSKL